MTENDLYFEYREVEEQIKHQETVMRALKAYKDELKHKMDEAIKNRGK